MTCEHIDTIIIGGGQAGLATGYHLAREGIPFAILDGERRVGDQWRRRWDSLRLFTPTRYSSLPGMRFQAPSPTGPTKDEMADYLEAYARRFKLPLRSGTTVDALTHDGERYRVSANGGTVELTADRIVVATGALRTPRRPAFADELDSRVVQIHAGEYRNTRQLAPGGVLIVGAGNSGSDIAMDVARQHPTWLVGRHPGHVPFRIEGRATRHLVHVVRFIGHHVINRRTPFGRKLIGAMESGGDPVVRIKPKDIVGAGVERVEARVAGVHDGLPVLEDGRVLHVANVIWCTGFHQTFPWIDLPVFTAVGEPDHRRGVVESMPGLYFMGLAFQFSVTSEVITGVGRDARFVVRHLVRRHVRSAARSEPERASA